MTCVVILRACELFTWHGLPARVLDRETWAGSPCHRKVHKPAAGEVEILRCARG
ncbi:MAG: hypothetical protein AVDCRST_MAG64-2160 [uncultured Phycisphaerae bacterium]|uniref:Uncharacterized protein n=1 Tax=uncultured Phycisphaerae bacterium TaxID=904963 RepID=A0A6J4P844_9BACT|nr:MAG: hypothetical protein AVDCRST_MAG64-2160 [uncultured Phycisphaerae bacterium]